jgi:hypothetical protein
MEAKSSMDNHKEQLEQKISELLSEGAMSSPDPDSAAAGQLSPRWEMRTQAEQDPIVEETNRYREIAREADDRYDEYMRQASRSDKQR